MAVNMNLGDQANLAALLRSLVWGSKGNMHISSRLSACSRLTGFCSSSFRGHFRSLFSPDYSVYWPPLCHGGFPPQPSPMAHRQFISVQDWPRLRLQQISAMATGRIGSQWELESRRPTLRMDGTLVLSCLSRWGASSSFAFQVCQSDFERNQQTYWQWPSHFDAFFSGFSFFFYSYMMEQTEAADSLSSRQSICQSQCDQLWCVNKLEFFSWAGLVVFDVFPGRQMFTVCQNAAFRQSGRVLSRQETNSSNGKNDGMRFLKTAFFAVQMCVSDSRPRCFFTTVWMWLCNGWL